MKPIKSPYSINDIKESVAKDALLMKLAADLLRIHDTFTKKVSELNFNIANIKEGKPGTPGVSLRGKDADEEKIIRSVLSKIKVRNGKDADENRVMRSVLSKIPIQKAIDIEEIIEKVKGRKIKISDVEELGKNIGDIRRQLDRRYLHGGGDTVIAGTGITITPNSEGQKVISTTSGAVPNFADNETPSGTIDGVNTTFTLAQNPDPDGSLILTRNRAIMIQGTDYTLSTTTITFTTAPPLNAILRAWYRYA